MSLEVKKIILIQFPLQKNDEKKISQLLDGLHLALVFDVRDGVHHVSEVL